MISTEVIKPKIKFIDVNDADENLQMQIRDWRNSAEVKKYFQIDYIDVDTHKNWLKEINKKNSSVRAFIINFEGNNIGLIYLHKIDKEKKKADIGIYIYNTELRGRGIGSSCIEFLKDYAFNTLYLNTLYLEVLKDNMRAINLYEKYGFKQVSLRDNVYIYKTEKAGA